MRRSRLRQSSLAKWQPGPALGRQEGAGWWLSPTTPPPHKSIACGRAGGTSAVGAQRRGSARGDDCLEGRLARRHATEQAGVSSTALPHPLFDSATAGIDASRREAQSCQNRSHREARETVRWRGGSLRLAAVSSRLVFGTPTAGACSTMTSALWGSLSSRLQRRGGNAASRRRAARPQDAGNPTAGSSTRSGSARGGCGTRDA